MHAQRQHAAQPVQRYRDVQGTNVLVTRDPSGKVVRLHWPVADIAPDAPGAIGTDGTPQSISPAVFRICMTLLVVGAAMVWVNILTGGAA